MLSVHTTTALLYFEGKADQLPEVQVCLRLTGEYDFLLQLTPHYALEYEVFLYKTLGAIPYLERYRSFLYHAKTHTF
jgi:hypothetical protein